MIGSRASHIYELNSRDSYDKNVGAGLVYKSFDMFRNTKELPRSLAMVLQSIGGDEHYSFPMLLKNELRKKSDSIRTFPVL